MCSQSTFIVPLVFLCSPTSHIRLCNRSLLPLPLSRFLPQLFPPNPDYCWVQPFCWEVCEQQVGICWNNIVLFRAKCICMSSVSLSSIDSLRDNGWNICFQTVNTLTCFMSTVTSLTIKVYNYFKIFFTAVVIYVNKSIIPYNDTA